MVAGKETASSFLSAFVSPCVHCLHTHGTECGFQRLGEYMFVKWPFRLPGGDKNHCCQDKQVEDTPWDSEVRAWPPTARHFPLWPWGPRSLRLNSGQRGSRAQALVAAGGPAGGDVERSRAFLGSNTVPTLAGLFHRGDTHLCPDKQGRSCCVLWPNGKCSNSKTGRSTGKHGACRPVEDPQPRGRRHCHGWCRQRAASSAQELRKMKRLSLCALLTVLQEVALWLTSYSHYEPLQFQSGPLPGCFFSIKNELPEVTQSISGRALESHIGTFARDLVGRTQLVSQLTDTYETAAKHKLHRAVSTACF